MNAPVMNINTEKQKQVQTLMEYFSTKGDGDILTWVNIEQETGVPMSKGSSGRIYARLALKRLSRLYSPIVGAGIQLSSPDTALSIVTGRFSRIDGAMRIADQTQQELSKRHLEKMAADEQRKMILAAGFFGTMRVFAEEARNTLVGVKKKLVPEVVEVTDTQQVLERQMERDKNKK